MTKTKKAVFNLESLESRENPSPLGGLRFNLPSFQFVSGRVYEDANANGARDAGENGVTVYADWNNNGVRDTGEPSTKSAPALSVRSVNGVTTATQQQGFYFFNAGGRNAPASPPIRVELPAGAALTGPVQRTVAGRSSQTIDIGLSGVTGTPDVPTTVPSSISVTTGSTGSSASGSLYSSSTTGSSSSSVYAIAYVGPDGQSFADVQTSVSGNGYASGTAAALGDPPAFASSVSVGGVYVG